MSSFVTLVRSHLQSMSYVYSFKSSIPELDPNSHKGQHGRIGVIGGCLEYTGAPYFSAIAALRSGADLVHVFCTSDAAIPIKSYSPDLIVHPALDRPDASEYICQWIDRLHAVVIGPGLGRSEQLVPILKHVMMNVKRLNIPVVFDADGLHFLTQDTSLVQGYEKAILTPNVAEFSRLCSASKMDQAKEVSERVKDLSKRLGNVTLLVKGPTDVISNGVDVATYDGMGSGRRCGGQGDILSGTVALFASWTCLRPDLKFHPCLIACLAASLLTRKCNQLAFQKFGRSMITSDMVEQIGASFAILFNK